MVKSISTKSTLPERFTYADSSSYRESLRLKLKHWFQSTSSRSARKGTSREIQRLNPLLASCIEYHNWPHLYRPFLAVLELSCLLYLDSVLPARLVLPHCISQPSSDSFPSKGKPRKADFVRSLSSPQKAGSFFHPIAQGRRFARPFSCPICINFSAAKNQYSMFSYKIRMTKHIGSHCQGELSAEQSEDDWGVVSSFENSRGI